MTNKKTSDALAEIEARHENREKYERAFGFDGLTDIVAHKDISTLLSLLRDRDGEIAEFKQSFDIRWAADMRAIKRWQEATGRTLVWPDHADLCVWLMGRLDAAELKTVFVCSNRTGQVHAYARDPQGHCPECLRLNQGNWSCIAVEVIPQ